MSSATILASSWPRNSIPSPIARPRLSHPQHTVEIFWSMPGTGIPFALLEARWGVRDITDIGERHGGPRLDPGAGRPISILDVVVAYLDRVGPVRDRPRRAGYALRHWRRPQWAQLTLERKHPHCIAVGAGHRLVAAGRD